jgi:nucleotidyltransferase/DNA polymerase involved in DNA repair
MEELLDSLSLTTARIKRLVDPCLPGEWVLLGDLCFSELTELAAELKVRAGMAPALCWAMLAAASVPGARAARVAPGEESAFLDRTPTPLLQAVGFSEYLSESLVLLGFATLKGCRTLSQRQLEARFGPEGKRLFTFLHPFGTEAVPAYRPASLTAGCELDPPRSEPAEILPYLSRTLAQLLGELGQRFCQSLSLAVSARDGRTFASSLLLKAPTREQGLLDRRFGGLLRELFRAGLEACRLQLTLRSITPAAGLQQDFFLRTLDLARLRQTERRFPGKLLRARLAAAPSLFPEDNTHFEPLFTQG